MSIFFKTSVDSINFYPDYYDKNILKAYLKLSLENEDLWKANDLPDLENKSFTG